MRREMGHWFQIPAALAAAAGTVIVALAMVGSFAINYDPVQPDGSIDNVPRRTLGSFVLGAPATLLIAFVIYLLAFNLHPPVGAFSWTHCLEALGLAVGASLLLAVGVRDSFARWYEAFYLADLVPVLFTPLEAGLLAGSSVGNGITSRCRRRGKLRRAAERQRHAN